MKALTNLRGNLIEKVWLATQIFVALILGIVVGTVFHGNETIKAIMVPIGDIFIHY
jgi:proton glutamate symport protein